MRTSTDTEGNTCRQAVVERTAATSALEEAHEQAVAALQAQLSAESARAKAAEDSQQSTKGTQQDLAEKLAQQEIETQTLRAALEAQGTKAKEAESAVIQAQDDLAAQELRQLKVKEESVREVNSMRERIAAGEEEKQSLKNRILTSNNLLSEVQHMNDELQAQKQALEQQHKEDKMRAAAMNIELQTQVEEMKIALEGLKQELAECISGTDLEQYEAEYTAVKEKKRAESAEANVKFLASKMRRAEQDSSHLETQISELEHKLRDVAAGVGIFSVVLL